MATPKVLLFKVNEETDADEEDEADVVSLLTAAMTVVTGCFLDCIFCLVLRALAVCWFFWYLLLKGDVYDGGVCFVVISIVLLLLLLLLLLKLVLIKEDKLGDCSDLDASLSRLLLRHLRMANGEKVFLNMASMDD